MLENVYEGLNARPKAYLSKEYFCEMCPTCVSSKLCEFILSCFQAKQFSEQKIREQNIFGFVKGKVKPKGEGEAKQN